MNILKQNRTLMAWHYTTGQKFKLIVCSGELRPTDNFITVGEKPIIWFSMNQDWEQTANKMLLGPDGTLRALTMEETRNLCGGLFRFGIPSDQLIRWPRLARAANMRSKVQRTLEESGLRQGADFREWCGLLEPVSIDALVWEEITDAGWVNFREN